MSADEVWRCEHTACDGDIQLSMSLPVRQPRPLHDTAAQSSPDGIRSILAPAPEGPQRFQIIGAQRAECSARAEDEWALYQKEPEMA